ncbi:SAM-dependent methyltransferase [Actinomadura chokoriensis]|uniref:SAM-dependent methyltransferase n=1 Tax=Actinomadura chokoriensis TaxID=454156 RepID=UPI0031F9C3EB
MSGDTAFDWRAAALGLSGGYDGDRPAIARLWAFWGGGTDYNPADRALGEKVAARFPQIEALARQRLAFRSRVVRALVGEGIDQILVAGVDMPMYSDVHAIAQSVNPDVRVVYADADELVMLYVGACLFSDRADTCGFVHAGLDDPRAVLAGAADTLDLDRPVAVLLINSLDVLSDPQAVAAISAFRTALAAGSHIAFCHLTAEYDQGLAGLGSMCAGITPGPPCVRNPAALGAFCAGMKLLARGPVSAPARRPESDLRPVPASGDLWCGVGVLS